ncbi:hypothetical protein B0H10DRAFT_2078606 [Mycena sp. CBHHK59/15]|nr:hypothetical protein B0H10DRAFT_2078606 [Mycena sp. CBHHK59/15]
MNPEVHLPFWVLTYWAEILEAAEARKRWICAASWLDNTGKTMEELGMKRGVKALWKTIGWHGNLPCFVAIPVSDMASFFSQDYLAGNLVDAMMDLLSVRLSTSAESISESALVVNTTFAQFIWLLLKKYGSWFCSPDHTHLYFVLHRPPDHWTACGIDFEKKHIRYGDSLRWQRPEDFFRALESGTTDQFPDAKFTVTKDLPCASQTDGLDTRDRESDAYEGIL